MFNDIKNAIFFINRIKTTVNNKLVRLVSTNITTIFKEKAILGTTS